MSMNPQVKAQWVAALRSGEYPQGKAGLSYPGDDGVRRFCCLGVLCDLAVKAGAGVTLMRAGMLGKYDLYNGENWFLPSSVVDWAGLDGPNPEVTQAGYHTTLASLNDYDVPFTGIADMIEAQL
jgi:hypothetical protein